MKFNAIALANVLLLAVTNVRGEQSLGKAKLVKKAQKSTHVPTYGECSTELFEGYWMYVGGICKNLFGVIIDCAAATEGVRFCEYTERVLEYYNGDDALKACDVGGSFSRMGKNQVTYDSCTGECTLEYFDLSHDPCELYTPVVLGLKAVINIKKDKDSMDVYFSNNGGVSFYNDNYPRKADQLTIVADTTEDEPARRGRHRRFLSEMDKQATISSSEACKIPTNFFNLTLIPDDYELVPIESIVVPAIGSTEGGVSVLENGNLFESDWLDLASCEKNEECKMMTWINAAGPAVGSISGVVDKWKGIFENGWPDDAGGAGDLIDGIGDFLNIGSTLFPPLALAGGILNTVGSVFGGKDEENITLLKTITKSIARIDEKLTGITKLINSSIDQVLEKIAVLEFNNCMASIRQYTKNDANLRQFSGWYKSMIESIPYAESNPGLREQSVKNFKHGCEKNIHYNILLALEGFVRRPDGCQVKTLKLRFLENPSDFGPTFGAWVTELTMELMKYEGFCIGVRGFKNDPFTSTVERIVKGLQDRKLCQATPESSVDSKCTLSQYCLEKDSTGKLLRECRTRFDSSNDDVCKGDNGEPRHNMCTSGVCKRHTRLDRVKNGTEEKCKKFFFFKYSCKTEQKWRNVERYTFACVQNLDSLGQ